MPVVRRVLLLGMFIAATVSNFDPMHAVGGGVLCVADVLASGRLFDILGYLPKGCSCSCLCLSRLSAKIAPARLTRGSTRKLPVGRQPEKYSRQRDQLEAVVLHAKEAVDRSASDKKKEKGNAADIAATLTHLLTEIQAKAEELLPQLQTMSDARLEAISSIVNAYLPSDDAGAEKDLLQRLTSLEPPPRTSSGAALQDHPVCVTRLVFALMLRIWVTVPCFFGKKVEGDEYQLSYEATRCSYFVSHSWRDNGRRKVAMLREFLFLQALIGRMMVICLVLAAFLMPFGFAIVGFFPDDLPPWVAYVPTAIPLSRGGRPAARRSPRT